MKALRDHQNREKILQFSVGCRSTRTYKGVSTNKPFQQTKKRIQSCVQTLDPQSYLQFRDANSTVLRRTFTVESTVELYSICHVNVDMAYAVVCGYPSFCKQELQKRYIVVVVLVKTTYSSSSSASKNEIL
jgi:cAMP phosphodiesterase